MTEIGKKIGEMQFDELITDINPAVVVSGGTIAKLATETTLVRGTVLSKGDDGKLAVMADGATADCILCDDTIVGTAEDVSTCVYIADCFDPNKVTVADGYALTEKDKDALRMRGIIFKAAN